ncbi:MAG: hypothetical protein HY735_34000 [Verrucomicrobia bacterium]|nr:hypothetical protein [Verrucomicrobiota bacterium]
MLEATSTNRNALVLGLVSIALAYQVSAWRKRGAMAERAQRGSWEKFDRVMAKVRDVPPLPGDER